MWTKTLRLAKAKNSCFLAILTSLLILLFPGQLNSSAHAVTVIELSSASGGDVCPLEPLFGQWDSSSSTCTIDQAHGIPSGTTVQVDYDAILALTPTGHLYVEGSMSSSGTIVNQGWIDIGSDGTVDNFGTIRNIDFGVITDAGTMTNNGTLTNTALWPDGGRIQVEGLLINYQTFNSLGHLWLSGIGALVNYGILKMDVMHNTFPGTLLTNYGSIDILGGGGGFGGDVVNEAGATFAVEEQANTGIGWDGTPPYVTVFTNYGDFVNHGGFGAGGPGGLHGTFDNFATLYTTGAFIVGGTIINELTGVITNANLFSSSDEVGFGMWPFSTFENHGLFDNPGNAVLGGTTLNYGSIESYGILGTNPGHVVNKGTIDVVGGGGGGAIGDFTNELGATFSLGAQAGWGLGGTFTNYGTFDNQGYFNSFLVSEGVSGTFYNYASFDNAGTYDNWGLLLNGDTGSINNPGQIINECGASYVNYGSFQGNPVIFMCNYVVSVIGDSIVPIGVPAALTATVATASNEPVSNIAVSFNSSPGGLSFVPSLPRTNATGTATVVVTTSTPGIYTIVATVQDFTATWSLVVYDPAGNSAGGGWYYPLDDSNSQLAGKATFGFVAQYQRGYAQGNLGFQFRHGDISLKSTSIAWLVVSSSNAQFKGMATVNGVSGYYFRVAAQDGGTGGSDTFAIKIWFGDPDVGGVLIHSSHNVLSGGNIIVRTK